MGMFDQTEKKKLIIVHSDNAIRYANFLQQMINNDDDRVFKTVGVKDGTVDTVVWSEKDYFAQKPQLSGDSYIVFIGTGKKLEAECYGMQEQFSQYSMKYSWYGKRAYLGVKSMVKISEYNLFVEYAKKYQPEIENILLLKKESKTGFKPENLIGSFRLIDKMKLIKEQQYQCLVLKFYMDGLGKFLAQR